MSASYASQKAAEVLSPLLSEADLDSRLCDAGVALSSFPLDSVPSEVQRKALILKKALTAYPSDERPPEGTIKGTIALLPEQRKRHLRDELLSFFQDVCEFKGKAEIDTSLDRQYAVISLEGPDCWEHLFWNLSANCSQELRESYIKYAGYWLKQFPDDVRFEWLGRHGYCSLDTWGYLPLERLRFTDESWDFASLNEIQALDSHTTEIGPDSQGAYHLNRQGDWLGQYIRTNGTWPAPIIVLASAAPHTNSCGRSIPAGLVLIEGHCRLSRLLNLPITEQQKTHRVWVVRVD